MLSGCTKITYGIISNKTSSDIKIITDVVTSIPASSTGKDMYNKMIRTFSVEKDGKIYEYRMIYPPDEYFEKKLTAQYIYLVVESDMNINVLKPGIPSASPQHQPEGFPLHPLKIEKR